MKSKAEGWWWRWWWCGCEGGGVGGCEGGTVGGDEDGDDVVVKVVV